ncbi:MAG: helix-turn-helix domain-containing protein, partial [Thermodesulfobacteriota bacterium]|nr:helix-turn-helix domain-containing protein [Thermodesulfobacteriota bacterium]
HGYDGQLFRGRYKSIVVEEDSYVLDLVRYIHRNPLEAGLVDNLQKYPWSSHKAYLSNAKKWKWLYKDYILKLFAKSKVESIRLYKKFVLKEIPGQINQIFGRRNLPPVLGSKCFIDRIKGEFFNVKNCEEIPEAKRLSPDIEEIKSAVCRAYHINESELYVSKRGYFNEPRNVAVYLARYLRNDTLKAVGENFGIEKYSTVSSIVEKVKSAKKSEKGFKKRVEILAEQIKNSS